MLLLVLEIIVLYFLTLLEPSYFILLPIAQQKVSKTEKCFEGLKPVYFTLKNMSHTVEKKTE